MNVLEIQSVSKRFGDKIVLDGLNLTVPKHSIFGFIGRNGAGKTTTMKSVIGLMKPDTGTIAVCGEKVCYGETKTNRNVGYLPDVPEFYGFMTTREYLHLCGEISGLSKAETDERTEKLLMLVGLSEEKHRIKGFSRGMKQRLGIAQALLGKPKLLICDEPTSALDPIGRKEILDILQSAVSETTVFFSTHILTDVERICTDAAFLHDGKIVLQGKIDEIKTMSRNRAFIVETATEADTENLLNAFHFGQHTAKNTVTFSETDIQIEEIFRFIADNSIMIEKIERKEADLESLFMEVIGK